MMKPFVLAFPGNEALAQSLTGHLKAEKCFATFSKFPDGESYVRIESPLKGRELILLCTLDRPDEKVFQLFLTANLARELGVSKIGLVAPYLPYMRQDHRFKDGEALSAAYFAKLLSGCFDFLMTVDPHLHRIHHLSEIYSIPTKVVHVAPLLAEWVQTQVKNSFLIGPDQESEQWVKEVANEAKVPFVILKKVRRGDKDVEISFPDLSSVKDRSPVLVDDIISTGHTMMETLKQLQKAGFNSPVCLGVHGVFAGDAYQELLKAGLKKIVTCNTVEHLSNGIDISALLVEALQELIA